MDRPGTGGRGTTGGSSPGGDGPRSAGRASLQLARRAFLGAAVAAGSSACAVLGGQRAEEARPTAAPTSRPTVVAAPPVAGVQVAPAASTFRTPKPGKSLDDLLALDVLHVVEIRLDPAHIVTLDTDRSVRVPCEVTLNGERYADGRIREKGSAGSSSNLVDGKPGFTITFGKDKPKGLDRLTLNNARQDASFLHEHLAYDLYLKAGLPAPRTAHAAVSVNGRSYGVYVLVESVDEEFLERAFGKGNHKGNLYEGTSKGDFLDGATDPSVLELKDEEEGRKRDEIRLLAQAAAADSAFAQAVGERLDLDRFITAYALDGLLAHWDGPIFNHNNYYLYANPKDQRLVLIPHGMDQVFDVSFDPLQAPVSRLAQRIRAIPQLDAKLRSEMNRVMDRVWDVPALLARAEQVGAALRSMASPSAEVARDVKQFEDTLQSMRDQVVARRERWRPV